MKTLIALLLSVVPLFAANPAVTYDSVTRNVSPTNANLAVATFTNHAATVSTIAGFDALKKLVSKTAGTDYAAPTTGSTFLKGNGSGGFSLSTSITESGTDLLVFDDITADTGTFTNGVTTGNGTGAAGSISLLEGSVVALTANSFTFYSPVDVAVGGLAFILPGTAGSGFLTSANVGGVMTLSFTAASDYVPGSRTITVAGTANEITSSAGAQDLSANRTWTLSLPATMTMTGKTLTGGTYVDPSISLNGATGDAGQMLTPWITSGSNATVAIALRWRKAPMVEEFDAGASGQWTFTALNSGVATVGGSPDLGDFGTANLGTGAVTNGGGISRMFNGAGTFSSGKLATTWRIRTPSALSSDVDIYRIWCGFGDATSASESVDGAYFEYTHSLSNGVWTAKTASNSVRTYADGATATMAVVAATWYTLRIEGDSTSVQFWVSNDDGANWTFVGSSGSNIPNTTSRLFGRHCEIIKEAGTTGTTAITMLVGRSVLWP